MKRILTLTFCLMVALAMSAQKKLYIPNDWKYQSMLYKENDPDNMYTWSKSRSKESENFIVYWDKGYGSTIPTNASSAYKVDIDDLLKKAESFYQMNTGKLGFCDVAKSKVSQYKIMILLNHTTDWICTGAGYDNVIAALWLSPSTCKPVGHSVAHEVGHSFQYQVFCDLGNNTGFRQAIGSGSTFWEQTAQWQAAQSYPALKFDESWSLFQKAHSYAMTHEWMRYQSYWWHYYLAEKYGIDFIGRLWRYNPANGVDPNESLMQMLGIDVNELYKMYFDYAMKMATLDLDVCRDEAKNYIGTYKYDYIPLGGTKHQVAYSSCPQATGFNIIPLNVPAAGTEVSTTFTALKAYALLAEGDTKSYFNGGEGDGYDTASGLYYNTFTNYSKRGFRLGYVALMKDGTRQYFSEDEVYCTGGTNKECVTSFTVPEGVDRLFMVVSPAPSVYFQHKWDEKIENDDQWPYTVEFSGTNILGAAVIADKMPLTDATITYDVYFKKDNSSYNGTNVKVEGEAAAALGTAMQLQSSQLGSVLSTWASSGPKNGKAMFYAVKPNGDVENADRTANGFGHWFNASGSRCAYGTSSYLFSEFYPADLTFVIGQYPGRVTNDKDYTIRQAVRYKNADGDMSTVTFVFNVHITTSRTGYELADVKQSEIVTSVEAPSTSVGEGESVVYTLSGVQTNHLQRGVNIVRSADGRVRKVMK